MNSSFGSVYKTNKIFDIMLLANCFGVEQFKHATRLDLFYFRIRLLAILKHN